MPKQISDATRKRAVSLVLDHLADYPNLTAACHEVARQFDLGAETVRRWVRQAQVEAGVIDEAVEDEDELDRLRRENHELREANTILRDAAVYFAGELGPRKR